MHCLQNLNRSQNQKVCLTSSQFICYKSTKSKSGLLQIKMTNFPISNLRLNRFVFKGGLSGKFSPNSFLVAGFTVMLLHLWGAHLPVFVAGPKGEPGQVATGVKGEKGDRGADGDVGDRDPQGDKGDRERSGRFTGKSWRSQSLCWKR